MSVVVWDGKTLAADCQVTAAGTRHRVSKIRKLESGEVLAWTGWQDSGLAMADWYQQGADPKAFPAIQSDENRWSRLVVASPAGVFAYEHLPFRLDVLDPYCAWGAGMDYALGALAMGADARRAVEVACLFSVDCGFGVEAYDLVSGNWQHTTLLEMYPNQVVMG